MGGIEREEGEEERKRGIRKRGWEGSNSLSRLEGGLKYLHFCSNNGGLKVLVATVVSRLYWTSHSCSFAGS